MDFHKCADCGCESSVSLATGWKQNTCGKWRCPTCLRNIFHGMAAKPDTPKVGVGVVLRSPNRKFLLVLRKGSHGAGLWSLPGGHMELGEDFYTTCKREIQEELGITIEAVKPVGFSNDIFVEEGLHYVTLFFEAPCDWDQTPRNMEPDKAEQIGWFDKQEALQLPNLFPPLQKVLNMVN